MDSAGVLREKKQTDKMMGRVRQILGYWLIEEATFEEDTREATDLRVLTLGDMRIAVRMRRYQYFRAYPNEFTIRCSTRNGSPSEYDKILSGWGDYFFYGFVDSQWSRFVAYKIGRLAVFRHAITTGRVNGRLRSNGVGDTNFLVFADGDMPEDYWVCRAGYEE